MSINDLLEFVNPPKLCVALWLREHVLALRKFDGHRDLDTDESGSGESSWLPSICAGRASQRRQELRGSVLQKDSGGGKGGGRWFAGAHAL